METNAPRKEVEQFGSCRTTGNRLFMAEKNTRLIDLKNIICSYKKSSRLSWQIIDYRNCTKIISEATVNENKTFYFKNMGDILYSMMTK